MHHGSAQKLITCSYPQTDDTSEKHKHCYAAREHIIKEPHPTIQRAGDKHINIKKDEVTYVPGTVHRHRYRDNHMSTYLGSVCHH